MARFLSVRNKKTEVSREWPKHADDLWVDIGPDDRDHVGEMLTHLYAPHPKVTENLLQGDHHRPSLLVEDDTVSFMLALIPVSPEEPLHHLSFIIGRHFLVTAHVADTSEVVDQAFDYVRENQLLDEGVDFALYQALRRHVMDLRQLANHLDDQFEGLHRRLLQHPYRNMSPAILHLRKRAMAVKHLLDPEGAIFHLLKSRDFPYVQKKNRPYFQDVSFLMEEVVAQVQSTREGLAEMVEAYTSLQSNEINLVMRFLTVISVLSLPATTIASIYGMNFNIPEIHWKYGYGYSLGLMFLVTASLLLYMKKHKNRND